MNQYNLLLNDYYKLISGKDWWDGRREALVDRMDKLWMKMKKKEQEASLEYIKKRYEKGIS